MAPPPSYSRVVLLLTWARTARHATVPRELSWTTGGNGGYGRNRRNRGNIGNLSTSAGNGGIASADRGRIDWGHQLRRQRRQCDQHRRRGDPDAARGAIGPAEGGGIYVHSGRNGPR